MTKEQLYNYKNLINNDVLNYLSNIVSYITNITILNSEETEFINMESGFIIHCGFYSFTFAKDLTIVLIYKINIAQKFLEDATLQAIYKLLCDSPMVSDGWLDFLNKTSLSETKEEFLRLIQTKPYQAFNTNFTNIVSTIDFIFITHFTRFEVTYDNSLEALNELQIVIHTINHIKFIRGLQNASMA